MTTKTLPTLIAIIKTFLKLFDESSLFLSFVPLFAFSDSSVKDVLVGFRNFVVAFEFSVFVLAGVFASDDLVGVFHFVFVD